MRGSIDDFRDVYYSADNRKCISDSYYTANHDYFVVSSVSGDVGRDQTNQQTQRQATYFVSQACQSPVHIILSISSFWRSLYLSVPKAALDGHFHALVLPV